MEITLYNAAEIAGHTAASLYAVMPVKLVVLLICLVFCFAGYKLLRIASALSGVILGVGLGIGITGLFDASMNELVRLVFTVLVTVIPSVALGAIFFRLRSMGLFALCACTGVMVVYVPSLFAAQLSQGAFWMILAAGAVLFGVTGLLFFRPAGILVTGLYGFGAAFVLLDFLAVPQGAVSFWIGLVLTAVGCGVQAMKNRSIDTCPVETDERADSMENDADFVSSPPAPEKTEVDDDTQVLDLSELPEEEPDEIDFISEHVAAHIGATQPMMPEANTQVFDTTEAQQAASIPWTLHTNVSETETNSAPAFSVEEVLTEQTEMPLEQQAEFAWMTEQPVEAPAVDTQSERTQVLGLTADLTNALEKVMHQQEEMENKEKLEQDTAQNQTATSETERLTERLDNREERNSDCAEAAMQMAQRFTIRAAHKKPNLKLIWPVLAIASALVLAGTGIQYAEIAIALSMVCYLLRYYRPAAFACAVLCICRILEVVQLVARGSAWQELLVHVVSAGAFLVMTYAAMRADLDHTDENRHGS